MFYNEDDNVIIASNSILHTLDPHYTGDPLMVEILPVHSGSYVGR